MSNTELKAIRDALYGTCNLVLTLNDCREMPEQLVKMLCDLRDAICIVSDMIEED